jgi:hypothetical protein
VIRGKFEFEFDMRTQSKTMGCLKCSLTAAWLEHVFLAREVIGSIMNRVPAESINTSVRALLDNQTMLARWFAKAGNLLDPTRTRESIFGVMKRLLDEHVTLATQIIERVRDQQVPPLHPITSSDPLEILMHEWYINASQIAIALAHASPHHWPEELGTSALEQLLRDLTAEIRFAKKQDFARQLAAFNETKEHILSFSALLSKPFHKQCCREKK